jgi:acyl-CoA thioesterase-1
MPIGDSITEAESGHNSYRRVLWNNLKESGCNVDFVGGKSGVRGGLPLNEDFDADHEGYWGYRVDQILPFISEKVVTYSPDMVLIHLGSNDVFQEQSIESTIEELGSVIDQVRIHKPDVAILLAQVIPSRRANNQLSLLNQEIFKLGKEKNSVVSPVIVVDQNSGYLVTDNYDGTHPAEAGEIKLADKWTNAILAHFGG